MPAVFHFGARTKTTNNALLLAQLQRVHHELVALMAIATHTPPGEPFDAAFVHLSKETQELARKFLRLSESLLSAARQPTAIGAVAIDISN
jgi:hypothetical protein